MDGQGCVLDWSLVLMMKGHFLPKMPSTPQSQYKPLSVFSQTNFVVISKVSHSSNKIF